MVYFTFLVISYFINGEVEYAVVSYENEHHCQEAMDQSLAMPLYDHLFELYGNTIMMKCHVSEEVSLYLKPRARPEVSNNG